MDTNHDVTKTLAPLLEILKNNGTGMLKVMVRKNFRYNGNPGNDAAPTLGLYNTSLYRHNPEEPEDKKLKIIPAKIAFSDGQKNLGYAMVDTDNFSTNFEEKVIFCCIPLDGKDVPEGTDGPLDGGDNASELYLHFFIPTNQEGYWEHGGETVIFLVDRKSDLIFREE